MPQYNNSNNFVYGNNAEYKQNNGSFKSKFKGKYLNGQNYSVNLIFLIEFKFRNRVILMELID